MLISHLPPSGWSDVARTRDLDQLRELLDLRFDAVDAKFEATEARLEAVIERTARDQFNRSLITIGLLLSVFAGIQAVVTQLIAG